MSKRNFKIIKEYIDAIQKIDNEKCWLFLDKEDQIKYCLLKENNTFLLKRHIKDDDNFDDEMSKYLNLNNKLLSSEQEEIIITNSLFKSHNYIETVTYSVSAFESKKFQNNNFFQLVINTSKSNLRLDFIFSNLISISTETHTKTLNGISFKVKDIPFNLYFFNDYFVVENMEKLDFEIFEQYSRTVLTCFGLLSGYVPRNEGYYFSYNDNKFENTKEFAFTSNFIDTYDVSYKPINSNLYYSFIPKNISEEERKIFEQNAKENLILISDNVFSKLCNLNIDNKKISRATELIMEANQTSLEAQGIIYSVVLEILTSFIAVRDGDKLITITDKHQAKKLQEELHTVTEKYISPYKNSPIYKKINDINSPTNMDKLLKPFEFLNIPLTAIDKTIINNRNDFLHGNDFIEGEELLKFFSNHFYINCKLNFLVYALLLKIVGHHGKIVNMVKIYLENDERVNDEEFYRNIGDIIS